MNLPTALTFQKLNVFNLDYFFLSPEDDKSVLFEETLLLLNEDVQLLDTIIIGAEENRSNAEGHLSVYFYTLRANRLLRLESQVNRDLETLSEVRIVKEHNETTTTRIMETDNGWDIFIDRDNKHEIKHVEQSSVETMILEGANLLLLRKIAINKIFGHFSGSTINREGEVCVCTYEVEEGGPGEVVVRRTVREPQGEVDVLTTTLTGEGRILEYRWSQSHRYLAHEKMIVDQETDSQEVVELVMQDEEIMADQPAYFEKKEELLSQYRLYHMDHTDVDDMIADFLKNLLFEKPEDVIEYADNYFSEFLDIKSDDKTEVSGLSDLLRSENSQSFG